MSALSSARGRELAKEVTRQHARSFYFASHLLTRARKEAAYAIYAFCRAADDAVDEANSVAEARERLDAMRRRLDAIYAERAECDADLALQEVVVRFRIDRSAFDGLLDGMESDLVPAAFKTTGELLRYCHLAAGVVGHLLLPVLGGESADARRRAADLGVAMQLTNILRDVDEDLERGRIYLPSEELAAFGLTHADIRERVVGASWQDFVAAQIQRTRALYARANEGIPLIRTWTGRVCARAMSLIYGDILRAIEQQGGDPFQGRARVSGLRKLHLLVCAVVGLSRGPKPAPSPFLLPQGGDAT